MLNASYKDTHFDTKLSIEPKCAHYSNCSGCNMQHIEHSRQLEFKNSLMLEELANAGIVASEVLVPIAAEIWNYRHRARLSARYVSKKDRFLIGFREPNGRYVADIDSCCILPERVSNLLPVLQSCIGKLEIAKSIPQIEVAVGDSDNDLGIVIRHLDSIADNELKELVELSKEFNFRLYLQSGNISSIKQVCPEQGSDLLSYGLDKYGLRLFFFPSEFTQINPTINKKLVQSAIEWLKLSKKDDVLELFCGIGNFSLPLATLANKVVSVEGEEQLINRAKYNASFNNIDNVEFWVEDLENDYIASPWVNNKYDKVLIDPPRTGALKILSFLNSIQPKMIAYVSCNAITLARDLDILVHKYGYNLSKVRIFDMFPHTSHWETLALLTKNNV